MTRLCLASDPGPVPILESPWENSQGRRSGPEHSAGVRTLLRAQGIHLPRFARSGFLGVRFVDDVEVLGSDVLIRQFTARCHLALWEPWREQGTDT